MTGKAASKEQFYVSASRGKFAISIHTDDKQSLLKKRTTFFSKNDRFGSRQN
jgi:hypothetical protein